MLTHIRKWNIFTRRRWKGLFVRPLYGSAARALSWKIGGGKPEFSFCLPPGRKWVWTMISSTLAGSADTQAARGKPPLPCRFCKSTLEPSFKIKAAPSRSAKASQFASQPLPYFGPNYWMQTEFTDIFNHSICWFEGFCFGQIMLLPQMFAKLQPQGYLDKKTLPSQACPCSKLGSPLLRCCVLWAAFACTEPFVCYLPADWSWCSFSFYLKSVLCKDSTVLTN